MTVKEVLKKATEQLETKKIPDAQASARFLLQYVLDLDGLNLVTQADQTVTDQELKRLWPLVERRASHEPIAYITGYQNFCGLGLHVSPAVLIPRPETEQLVELVAEYIQASPRTTPLTILDIGTGSGAIILALANRLNQRNDTTFIATDISKEALGIAKANAKKLNLGQKIIFKQTDLLQKLSETLNSSDSDWGEYIIVTNLPYIPAARIEKLEPDVINYEPHQALDGGVDGLKLYRKLFDQLTQLSKPPKAIFCEIDSSQGKTITEEVKKRWLNAQVEIKKDLALYDRFALMKLPRH